MKKTISLAIVFAIIFNFLGMISNSTVYADSGITMESINSFKGAKLYNIAYNEKNTYVALGTGNYAKVSKDGKAWTTVSLDAYYNINAVAWNEGKFVAVGANNILTSKDGKAWKKTVSFDTYELDSVVYAGGKFFSYGYDYMLVSEEGDVWKEAEIVNDEYNFYLADNILWNGNKYYCYTPDAILSSADGIEWTLVQDEISYNTSSAGIYNNKVYATVVEHYDKKSSSYSLRVTEDGEKWSKIGSNFDGYINKMIYDNNKYALLGAALYKDGSKLYTSSNGKIWNTYTFTNYISDIAINSRRYVVVGDDGYIASSIDGKKWTQAAIDTTCEFYKVIWNGSSFIALANYEAYYSKDGLKWTKLTDINPRNTYLYETKLDKIGDNTFICYDDVIITIDKNNKISTYDEISEYFYSIKNINNKYIAVGERNVAVSEDGLNWNYNTTDLDVYTSFVDVVWLKDKYVAVGRRIEGDSLHTVYAHSQDGLNWNKDYSDILYLMISMAANEKAAVAADYLGSILYTEDGIDWEEVYTGEASINAVRYVNNRFVALSESGSLLISTDGKKWTSSSVKSNAFLLDIIWTGSEYRIYGFVDGRFTAYTSKDLKSWLTQKLSLTFKDKNTDYAGYYYMNQINFDGVKYLAVGSHIFISTDGIKWEAYGAGGDTMFNSFVKSNEEYITVGNNGCIFKIKLKK